MTDNSVELIGFYGGDETHALSAWTSTARELTDERRGRMGTMLTRLATDGHHTPFEKSFLHFLVTCEVATHIQIIKHRIGVSVNAESARYKEHRENKHYVPPDWPPMLARTLVEHSERGFRLYHDAIAILEKEGVSRKRAKESARFFLPYAAQTTMDVAFNFRSFMHFLGLRHEEHAQQEIQWVSEKMLEAVRKTDAFDLSLNAFGYGL